MQLFKASATFLTVLLLPIISSAQGLADGNTSAGPFGGLLFTIIGFINQVLIPFIFAIGFLVFVWGMFLYFVFGGANDESKKNGKSLMIWATIGFVMMIIFWGVVRLIAVSTGFELENISPLVPRTPFY